MWNQRKHGSPFSGGICNCLSTSITVLSFVYGESKVYSLTFLVHHLNSLISCSLADTLIQSDWLVTRSKGLFSHMQSPDSGNLPLFRWKPLFLRSVLTMPFPSPYWLFFLCLFPNIAGPPQVPMFSFLLFSLGGLIPFHPHESHVLHFCSFYREPAPLSAWHFHVDFYWAPRCDWNWTYHHSPINKFLLLSFYFHKWNHYSTRPPSFDASESFKFFFSLYFSCTLLETKYTFRMSHKFIISFFSCCPILP